MTTMTHFNHLEGFNAKVHYLELNDLNEVHRKDKYTGPLSCLVNLITAIWRCVTRNKSRDVNKIMNHVLTKLENLNYHALTATEQQKLETILTNLGEQLTQYKGQLCAQVQRLKATLPPQDPVAAPLPTPPLPREAGKKGGESGWLPGKILTSAEITHICKNPIGENVIFTPGSLLIISRSNGNYQVVTCTAKNGNFIDFIDPDSGEIWHKEITAFYRIGTPISPPMTPPPAPKAPTERVFVAGAILSTDEIAHHCHRPVDAHLLKKGDLLIVKRSGGEYQVVTFLKTEGDRIHVLHPLEGILHKETSYFYPIKQSKNLHSLDHKLPEAELDPLPEEAAIGERTRVVGNWFAKKLDGYVADPDPAKMGVLRYKGKDYELLNGASQNISTKPMALVGGCNQEVILLDPANCPKIDIHYRALKKVIEDYKLRGTPLSTEEIVQLVGIYIYRHIIKEYDRDLNGKDKALPGCDYLRVNPEGETFVKDRIQVVPLERLVIAEKAVCRHHAFLATYFMDRLTQDRILTGKAQFIRDNLDAEGAHAWMVYMPVQKPNHPPEAWHVDTTWQEIINFANPEGLKKLNELYGVDVVSRMLKRVVANAQPKKGIP